MILCALKTKIEIALGPTCFYVGYIIRRPLLLFSPGFFQDLKKINVGGGERPALEFSVGIFRSI